MKWEYDYITGCAVGELWEQSNEIGKYGWELVSATENSNHWFTFWFKRPLREETNDVDG